MKRINFLKHHIKNYLLESKNDGASRYKKSYSQSGEDAIVKFIFDQIGVNYPTYLDIGAHHPFILSNTALLSLSGSTGVNIEPNPTLFKLFEKNRSKDVNINMGISEEEGELDYYSLSDPGLNTFSKKEAEEYVNEHGHKLLSVDKMKTITIANVLKEHCNGIFPDFLSLDVEGLDLSLLKSIDYEGSTPTVICAETSTHSTKGHTEKIQSIIDFVCSKDYILYADTNINSIFVKRDKWLR